MFRRYLRRTGFRSQLTLILSASILGLALFSSLINSWEASARMRAYFIEQGQRVADNLARQSTLALLFHSAENARDVVGATLAFPDVAGVQISDAKHHVLLAKLQQGVTLDAAAAGQAALTHATLVGENGDAWVFGAPVYGGQAEEASPFDVQEHQPQLLGYVHVQIGKDTLHRLTWSLLVSNLAITLSFAAILLLLVGLLARHMINPLNALSALMRRAEAGESGMRAAPAGPRDLIEMGQAFNQMMNVLEQREEELTGSRDAAVSMARMKAQFAATVSHEVRTPLNGVVGMLDMLKETQLTARQQEQVDVAWNSSRTLIELINNILDFSKMEAGKLTLEEHEFDLRKPVEEVIDLVARPAQQKGIDVGYLLAPGTPERVSGDSLRLRQILIILLGNAVKFTERGEVALYVAAAELAAQPPADHADDSGSAAHYGLRFAVRDTGIGISEPAQRQLFVSFAQSEPSTTRRYGGTGLGLAICKQLVGLLGGDIGVSSTPGFGTSFVFTIGCTPVSTAPPHDAGLSGVRVLAVDNSAIVRAFLQDLLTRHGALHHVGASGDMALAELKHADAAGHPYQLVILDVAAIDERGADLASRIEASGLTPHLLLLDRHGRHGGGSVSGHATLGKPLRQDRLLAALRELLAGRRHTETARLPGAAAPGRWYRVLVAEDNRTNQMVAAAMLAMHGCQCEFAFNGREAVDAAQRQRYDLILMDCSMPEMDGYEATAHIRAAEEALGRRTPLVAMTANTQRGDAEKCLAAGMDDYLAKPITLIELRHKLDKWLPHGDAHAYATEHDAAPSDNAPEPVDRALFGKLRELLGSTLAHAVPPFLEDTPVYLDELEQARRSGDIETARARAHALKGSSGNLGAVLLAQLAGQAEQLAIAHQLPRIVALLPALRAAYHDVAGFLSAEIGPGHDAADAPREEAPQVLVVDDDRSTRSTLRYTLQRDGFRVEEAADGVQALAMLKRCQPDVILMDAVMPVMDGFTACARLQDMPGGASIPVLMITALQDNSSVERAFAAGASDYIPKPIHYAVLSQRVRRIIEANRAEKRIRHLAYNDVLTGLPNRTLFFEQLAQGIVLAESNQHQLAVLFMDLDRFKYVNDNLGHDVGDRLLAAVAQRVRNSVRNIDTVARLGGAAHLPRAGRALPDRRPRHLRHQQRRHRHVSARRRRRGHAGQARRQRHVPRQAHQHRLPVLRSVDGAVDLGTRAAGKRSAPRAGAAAAGGLLPAAGHAGRRPHRRDGSAGALAPPAARHGVADGIHPAGRGNRPDQPARRLGLAHRLRAAAALGGPGTAAAAGGRQPVGAPAAAKGFRRHGGVGAGRHRPGAAAAGAGDHRRHADGKRGRHAERAAPPARAGRAAVDRRFRHRLFLAVLPEALPGRHHQDRPFLRARPAAGRRRRGHRHRHHRAGAQPAPGGGGRGRRDGGAAALPAGAALRPAAGLPSEPGHSGRAVRAADRRPHGRRPAGLS